MKIFCLFNYNETLKNFFKDIKCSYCPKHDFFPSIKSAWVKTLSLEPPIEKFNENFTNFILKIYTFFQNFSL
jgi:protein-disulfide isomerase